MERHIRRGAKKSKYKKILAVAAILLIVLGAAGYMLSNVDEIEYVGSSHYEDDELTELIFGTNKPNSIYFKLFTKKDKTIPFIEKYDVDIEWPSKIYVTVYEKSIIGYISYMGCNMYFDREGVVVESTSEYYEGVPQLLGLKFNSIVLNSKLDVGDDEIFDEILELTQAFKKYELDIDKVYYDSSYNVTLHMGNVRVELGDASDSTEKLYTLKQISDKLKNMNGTLDMSNYDGNNNSIIFKKENEKTG